MTSELISGKLVDPNIRADLRDVYMALYDSSIVADIPELAIATDLERRYVAELVGVLQRINGGDDTPLAIVNAEVGEAGNDGAHTLYQAGFCSDQEDRKAAEFRFDFYVPAGQTKAASAPRTPQNATHPDAPTRDANPAGLPACRCGCKEICNRGRNYRPGHDARHAGQIARYIAEKDDEEVWDSALSLLPTQALRDKASDMAIRLLKKVASRTHATRVKLADDGATNEEIEKVQFVSGKVKVGRWWYPAEQNLKSGAVSFTRKGSVRNGKAGSDKAEVADAKTVKTFVPNPITTDDEGDEA